MARRYCSAATSALPPLPLLTHSLYDCMHAGAANSPLCHYAAADFLFPYMHAGGNNLLHYYGLSQFDKWEVLGIVGAFFCFWMVLAWLVLAYVRHHRR